MRTSASVETCSLSMRQCQQTAIARMHCINSGHTNISVEFCLSLWNKFGLLLYTVEKGQTNATSVIMHPLMQAI